jgi:hypothetical protein
MGIVLDRARWLSNGGGQDGNTPVERTGAGSSYAPGERQSRHNQNSSKNLREPLAASQASNMVDFLSVQSP